MKTCGFKCYIQQEKATHYRDKWSPFDGAKVTLNAIKMLINEIKKGKEENIRQKDMKCGKSSPQTMNLMVIPRTKIHSISLHVARKAKDFDFRKRNT